MTVISLNVQFILLHIYFRCEQPTNRLEIPSSSHTKRGHQDTHIFLALCGLLRVSGASHGVLRLPRAEPTGNQV